MGEFTEDPKQGDSTEEKAPVQINTDRPTLDKLIAFFRKKDPVEGGQQVPNTPATGTEPATKVAPATEVGSTVETEDQTDSTEI